MSIYKHQLIIDKGKKHTMPIRRNSTGVQNEELRVTFLDEKMAEEEEKALIEQCIAELIGTALLLAFGSGSVAQMLLTDQTDLTALHMTWGMGVAFGVVTSYRISGAHLNPAVSVGFWSVGSFPSHKVAPYILAQIIGAVMGSCFTFLSYYDLLYDNMTLETSSIFTTYRGEEISWIGAFVIEFLATAMLQIGIMVIVDEKHAVKANVWLVAGFVGLLVVAIGMSFGANTGYAINPARDFGPRFFTLIAGWGAGPWTARGYYFIVPITAPFLGSIAGAKAAKHTILSYD